MYSCGRHYRWSRPSHWLSIGRIDFFVTELDEQTLSILGPLPGVQENSGPEIHSELTLRWGVWTQQGVPEDEMNALLKKYAPVGDLWLEAPAINPELLAAVPAQTRVRDEHDAQVQNVLGSALSALGQAMTLLLNNPGEVPRLQLLQLLSDVGKLLSSCFHSQTVARRAYVLSNIANRTVKQALASTTPTQWLFGDNIVSRIRELRHFQWDMHELASVSD